MSKKEQYIAVVERYLVAVGACDVEGVMNLLSDDMEYWIPGSHAFSGTHTKAIIKELLGPMTQMFPNGMSLSINSAICEGNRLAVEASGSAVAVSGMAYENRYHFMFEFDDQNKIRIIHEYMDTDHALTVFSSCYP